MDFKKKLRIRLYVGICCVVIGIVTILTANITKTENAFFSSFGLAVAVCGAVRIRNYFIITKDEETIRKQKVAESDERNIEICNRAKSVAFGIYVLIGACGVIVLHMLNKIEIASFLAYSVCALVVIYWVAYLIISKKS